MQVYVYSLLQCSDCVQSTMILVLLIVCSGRNSRQLSGRAHYSYLSPFEGYQYSVISNTSLQNEGISGICVWAPIKTPLHYNEGLQHFIIVQFFEEYSYFSSFVRRSVS